MKVLNSHTFPRTERWYKSAHFQRKTFHIQKISTRKEINKCSSSASLEKDRSQGLDLKKEDRAQAGALFTPWVELSDPGWLVTKRPTSLGQAIRPLLKELGQIDRKAQKGAQLKEYDQNPKASQAYREKDGSLEDKLTSLKDKIKIK